MESDIIWKSQRAVGRWMQRAISFPDDHGLICVGLVVLAGLAGYVWGLVGC